MKRLLLTIFLSAGLIFVFGQKTTDNAPIKGKLIVKLKPSFRNVLNDRQNNFWWEIWKNTYPSLEIKRKFPRKQPVGEKYTEDGKPYVDLSLIYECSFSKQKSGRQLKLLLLRSGYFEYAEFIYPVKLFSSTYIPSDPKQDQQYYLDRINAYRAWGEHRGDSTIILGLSDTGTDTDHPDLVDNIAYNYQDTIDGIDNDNDGYVDNYYGWDLGEMDNDPNVHKIGHGAHISGILGARTDNNKGMAGVGFRCKYLPLKIDDEKGALTKSYESIIYAADHGCAAINCSWGGPQGAGAYGQDIINYATYNKDMLVVAAAGNSNTMDEKFPASYENVLSVTATNRKDYKWVNSTYNYSVDLAAPGSNIFSTWLNGNYLISGGTSMASPMATATAGLVRSRYPSLNARQIGEQIRVNTSEIYNNYVNQKYHDKLGTGILDMYAALYDINKPAVRFSDIIWRKQGPNTGIYDTIVIRGTFTNYLDQVPLNGKVTLSCDHSRIQVIDSLVSIGGLKTMASMDNYNQPFRVVILPGMPLSEKVNFRLTYDYKTSSSDYQYISQILNRGYFTLNTGDFKATFNSFGRLGYNDANFKQGIGLLLNNLNESMISTGGFLVGKSSSKVSDAVYGDNGFDNDFSVLKISGKADTTSEPYYENQYDAAFNDSAAGNLSTGLNVHQRILDWSEPDNENYIVLEYILQNETSSSINNVYSGYYIDWDIYESHRNRAEWNNALKTAYAYDTEGHGRGGLRILKANAPVYHYAFDNDGANNSIEIHDGFADYEKWQGMQNNRKKAGFNTSKGNDVSHMVSSGPYDLAPGDSVIITYALLAADHQLELENAARAAEDKYFNISNMESKISENEVNIYPNPSGGDIYLETSRKDKWQIELFTGEGRKILSENFCGQTYDLEIPGKYNGLFILKLMNENTCLQKKLLINQ